MLRNSLLATAIIMVSSAAIAAPVSYSIDPAHTDALFSWNHFGYSNPTGHLGQATGTIVFVHSNRRPDHPWCHQAGGARSYPQQG